MQLDPRLHSKRTPISEDQAVLMALLMQDLLEAFGADPCMDNQQLHSLPAYQRFILGARACGFVCREESVMCNFNETLEQAVTFSKNANTQEIRLFLHSLLICESWTDGLASPVRLCIKTGAMEVLAKRLKSDDLLRMPTYPVTRMAHTAYREDEVDEMLGGRPKRVAPQTQDDEYEYVPGSEFL